MIKKSKQKILSFLKTMLRVYQQAKRITHKIRTWTVCDCMLKTRPVSEGKASERIGGAIPDLIELLLLQIQSEAIIKPTQIKKYISINNDWKEDSQENIWFYFILPENVSFSGSAQTRTAAVAKPFRRQHFEDFVWCMVFIVELYSVT